MDIIRERPLGTAQRYVLGTLADTENGQWYIGCGWAWEHNIPWTVRIMESLVQRGLVDELERDQRYGISDAGMRRAVRLRHPW